MSGVRLVLSDVDGTLITPDKTLTKSAIRAVHELGDAGIIFAITSARPPQGLAMFVEPLQLTTPLGALNGALVVDGAMRVLEELTIDADVTAPIIDVLRSHDLSVWVYQGADWFVLDEDGPHVQHEARGLHYAPMKRADFKGIEAGVTKLVGVSDDSEASAAAAAVLNKHFDKSVSATRSQSYFLDVTHLDANKGSVVRFLSNEYDVAPDDIVTIGDMFNDVSMFTESGFSIAMGNADDGVQKAASVVTKSNADEGFAHAVNTFILKR
ncbi:MAG: Cof-type HAD-IIB family hydrolase [Acidimicrobiales bacterium]